MQPSSDYIKSNDSILFIYIRVFLRLFYTSKICHSEPLVPGMFVFPHGRIKMGIASCEEMRKFFSLYVIYRGVIALGGIDYYPVQ